MDPITQAISGALNRLDEDNINDLYTKLKADMKKLSDDNLAQALENLEQNPESEERLEDLEDEITVSGVKKDKVLLTRAKTLLSVLHPSDTSENVGSSGTVLVDDTQYSVYYDDEDYDLEIG
jgi:uncharacterized protein YPO0396